MKTTRDAWDRLGGVARVLGDAVATPRGAAPDRAPLGSYVGGKRW
jgi:hypothetical protein